MIEKADIEGLKNDVVEVLAKSQFILMVSNKILTSLAENRISQKNLQAVQLLLLYSMRDFCLLCADLIF